MKREEDIKQFFLLCWPLSSFFTRLLSRLCNTVTAYEERLFKSVSQLVQFIVSSLQWNANETEFLERDCGGSGMQPAGDYDGKVFFIHLY